MIAVSKSAKRSMPRRESIHDKTRGRCFYCGIHVRCGSESLPHDWLLVRGNSMMVPEHSQPVSRGGTDDLENMLPSCTACNNAKGSLTLDEFRFLRGLRIGDPSHRFPGEAADDPPVARDWLCVHSQAAERDLFVANMPYAAEPYARGRSLKKRDNATWGRPI